MGDVNLHSYCAFLLYKKYKIPWGLCSQGILFMHGSNDPMLPMPLLRNNFKNMI